MPLSVVEGHKDGAVTDFDWLDTPQTAVQLVHATATEEAHPETVGSSGCQAPGRQGSSHEVDAILCADGSGVDRPGWDLAAHD
jgi:hypothetical protein